MKRALLLCLLLPLSLALYSQSALESVSKDKKVNYGAKVGFTSTIYLSSTFQLENVRIKQIQNNYKVGYNASAFVRFNMGKHYIQPELTYNVNKCEVVFEKNGNKLNTPADYASINSEIHSFELPILYGYNFIKKGIYGMSIFMGPKIRYLWESRSKFSYNNFNQTGIDEEFYPINLGLAGGVAVYIANIFFDFRYEQIVHNISRKVNHGGSQAGADPGTLKMHRRDNTLSFSLGVIF